MISVQITLEGEQDHLIQAIDKLNNMKVTILEMNDVILKEKLRTIIIGHVIYSDVQNTIDRINKLEGAYIINLEVKLSDENKSSTMIVIEADFGMKNINYNKIQEITNEKGLLMINEADDVTVVRKGAGSLETASAILTDLINITKLKN